MSTPDEKMVLNPSDWVSQTDAAKFRGVSRQAIWKLVKQGRVKTIIFGGRVFIFKKDIESFETPSQRKAKK